MVNWDNTSYSNVIQCTGRLKMEVNGISESGFDICITYFPQFNLKKPL